MTRKLFTVFLSLLVPAYSFGFEDKGEVLEVRIENRITLEKSEPKMTNYIFDEDPISISRVGTYSAPTKDVENVLYEKSDLSETVIVEREGDKVHFDLILDAAPATNVFSFLVEGAEDFNFFYQPPLNLEQENLDDPLIRSCTETDCVDFDGNVVLNRPENVVGSFAVYHKTKKNNRVGGKNYKTGKAFHVFRPKATDANGVETWATLEYKGGYLVVTVPQKFLAKATYPVRVDPTFGDTTYGISNGTRAANSLYGSVPATNPTEDGTVTSIHLSIDGNGVGSINTKGVLLDYVDNFSTITVNGVSPSAVLAATAGGVYVDINYSASPSIVNGSPYLIACVSDATTRYFYDSGITTAIFDDSNSYATPQDVGGADTGTGRIFSFYITYTASGGGAARRVIVVQ